MLQDKGKSAREDANASRTKTSQINEQLVETLSIQEKLALYAELSNAYRMFVNAYLSHVKAYIDSDFQYWPTEVIYPDLHHYLSSIEFLRRRFLACDLHQNSFEILQGYTEYAMRVVEQLSKKGYLALELKEKLSLYQAAVTLIGSAQQNAGEDIWQRYFWTDATKNDFQNYRYKKETEDLAERLGTEIDSKKDRCFLSRKPKDGQLCRPIKNMRDLQDILRDENYRRCNGDEKFYDYTVMNDLLHDIVWNATRLFPVIESKLAAV